MWQQLLQSRDQIFQAVGIASSSRSSKKRQLHVSRSTSPKAMPPCSDLYDLVLAFLWERVIHHCQEHPQDAQFQEGDGMETPLYLACQWHPPIEAVRALIQAFPGALRTTSREHHDLPLHCVCRYATTTSVLLQEFLHRYPSTVVHATKHGKTALQVLWEFARPDCVKHDGTPQTEEEHLAVKDFWKKMELLVQAVAIHRQRSWPSFAERELHLVHAVVYLGALGCPLPVLEYVCDKHPHQLQQRDGSGRLPLHLAVGPTQWSPSNKRKYKPREQDIIQALLKRYPQAAQERLFSKWDYYDTDTMNTTPGSSSHRKTNSIIIDRSGRYPLHIAVANRHTWDGGVEELFTVAPEILSIRDPVTQLYPFQLAAIPVIDTVVVNATTIYELLRLQPDLVTGGDENIIIQSSEAEAVCAIRRKTLPHSFVHDGYLSQHCLSKASCADSFTPSEAQKSSLHASRDEGNHTVFFAFGVSVAVGAGLWCWNQKQHCL